MHMTSGAPDQLILLPRATYLPLWTALTTAGVVLAFLFKLYLLALALALVVVGLFVRGAQSAGLPRDYGPLPVGLGVSVPPHTEVTSTPPWWALVLALIADGTLFTSLVFGTFYLWIAATNWPPAVAPGTNLPLSLGCVLALVVAAVGARGSLRIVADGRSPRGWIGLTALALVGTIATVAGLIGGIAPRPVEHAVGATAAALLGFIGLHAAIGLAFLLSNVLRIGAGRVSSTRIVDLRLTRLWLDYCAVTGAIAIGLVLSLPSLVAMLAARP